MTDHSHAILTHSVLSSCCAKAALSRCGNTSVKTKHYSITPSARARNYSHQLGSCNEGPYHTWTCLRCGDFKPAYVVSGSNPEIAFWAIMSASASCGH